MAAKTVLFICLLSGAAFCATIPIRDNIPVEVRYDSSVNNLDAKVQLSPEELGQALKHLPMAATVAENAARIRAEESSPPPVESSPPPVESSPPLVESSQPPVEFSPPPVESSQPPVESSQPPVESAPSTQQPVALQQLRATVVEGLKRLRDSFRPGQGQAAPDGEQWASLERAVDELFAQQSNVKQSGGEVGEGSTAAPAGGNIFQNIMNGVNQLTSGWVANIQNRPQGTQGDTGTEGGNNQGGLQGFVQYFTNGVSNIMNQLNNNGQSTTSNTVLGDSEVTSSSPTNPLAAVGGFFSSVANNVQQAFNNRPGNNSPPGTQGDTDGSSPSSGPPNPIQAIQNFGNSVGSAINNIFQGQSGSATTSGDEEVPASGGSNNNVDFIQSIGNAIQNSPLNPFRPQTSTTQKPVQAAQPSATEAPSASPPANDQQKKPSEETPLVVEPIALNENEEPQKDNEVDANKETLVATQ